MADIGPPYPPPPPPPTENVYTPSQFESVKEAFKHFLFKIIPKDLKPVFLLLHDKLDNAYHSVDTRGRLLTRDDMIETELYDLRRKCTNDGANAGSQNIKIEPAANSIVLLHYCSVQNGDTVTRTSAIRTRTAGGVSIGILNSASLGAGAYIVAPRGVGAAHDFDVKSPFFITDVFELFLEVAAVAVSQDSSYFLMYSFIGDAPTITETGPTGSTFADVS